MIDRLFAARALIVIGWSILSSLPSTAETLRSSAGVDLPIGCLVHGTCFAQSTSWKGEVVSAEEPLSLEDALKGGIGPSAAILGTEIEIDPELTAKIVSAILADAPNIAPLSEEQLKELEQFPETPPPLSDHVISLVEAYRATDQAKLCHGSVLLLAAAEVTEASQLPERIAYFAALYNVFMSNCFSPIEPSDTNILDRLVLLSSSYGQGGHSVYCSGFNFRGPFVLTSKHCLVAPQTLHDFLQDYGADNKTDFIENVRVKPDSIALVGGNPPNTFTFEIAPTSDFAQDLRFNPNLPGTDAVILKLRDFSRNVAAFPIGTVERGDELRIFGNFFVATDVLTRPPEDLEEDLQSQIRIDDAPTCRAYFVGNGCVYYGCQTFAGFSGSPVLVRRGTEWHLGAIHTGASGTDQRQCGYNRVTIFPNYGVDISKIDAFGLDSGLVPLDKTVLPNPAR